MVLNQRKQTQTITVATYLVSLFSYEPKFEDDDYQAPVTIHLTNKSISATSNGVTSAKPISTEETDSCFTSAGSHEVTLDNSLMIKQARFINRSLQC